MKKLAEEEGVSQKTLALKLDKDQNTVKAIIDKLERNHFVLRCPNKNDKRAFSLFLTDEAKNKLADILKLEEESVKHIYLGLDDDTLKKLSSVLEDLRKNINKL